MGMCNYQISFTIARKGHFKILELQHNTSGQATVRDLVGMSLLEYATRIYTGFDQCCDPRCVNVQVFGKAIVSESVIECCIEVSTII